MAFFIKSKGKYYVFDEKDSVVLFQETKNFINKEAHKIGSDIYDITHNYNPKEHSGESKSNKITKTALKTGALLAAAPVAALESIPQPKINFKVLK